MVFIVVVGRFQIFTIGHLAMLLRVMELSANGSLVIVLGSAQESGTFGNPFSAYQREVIIGPALKSAGIFAQFRHINDVGNFPIWAHKLVDEVIGTDDIIVYGGEDSSALKACAGIGIRTVPLKNFYKDPRFPRGRMSAGYVGDLICRDDPGWKRCVPPKIAEALMAEVGDGMTGIDIIKKTRGIKLLDKSLRVEENQDPLNDPQVRNLLYGQGGPFGPKTGLQAFKTVVQKDS